MLGKHSCSKLHLWGPHTALLFTLPVNAPVCEQFQPRKALKHESKLRPGARDLDSPRMMGSQLHWSAIRLALLLPGAFLCVATTVHLSPLLSIRNLVFPCSANQLSVDTTKY